MPDSPGPKGPSLLRDGAVRRDGEREPRFITVAGRRRVLNDSKVVHDDVARDRTRGVFVARV